MAKPDATGGADPSEHPLVKALVPDPSQPPEASVSLIGLRGRSASADTLRLYLTATLDEYVEVREADVIHSRALPDDGGTQVWLRSRVPVRHVRVESRQVQAEFLGGSIAEGYASAAGSSWTAAANPAAVLPPTANPRHCPAFSDLCQTTTPQRCPTPASHGSRCVPGGYEPADVGGTISPTWYERCTYLRGCRGPDSDRCSPYL